GGQTRSGRRSRLTWRLSLSGGRLQIERRVLVQDRQLERLERPPRLDAQLLDERAAGLLVGGERLGLTAGTVERDHQLGPQLFTERMIGNQRLELADQTGVPPKCDLGLDPLLERVEMELLETQNLPEREALLRELGKRRASPERKRLPQPRQRGSRRE